MADLTTLALVQQYGQIPTTDAVAAASLQTLISAVSAWFVREVNRGSFLEASYTEQRNGQGGDAINTINWPIQSVQSVTVDGTAIPASSGLPGAYGFTFDSFSIWLTGYRFRRARGNVQLVYTAGYPTVPLDVQQAVTQQVLFTFRQAVNLGTVSQSSNGILTAAFSQKDLAPGVAQTVAAYTSGAVVGL